MEKRQRPTTYAEALEAKKYAETNNVPVVPDENPIDHEQTSLSGVEVTELPSQGKLYGKGARIYFSPLSFGEMKFLSGSSLSGIESINFFLSKIQTTFDKYDLSYFDFYYITVLIKLSTFGDSNFNIRFECPKCLKQSSYTFNTADVHFEELRVPIPAVITSKDGNDYKFSPITVGKYIELIKEDKRDDYDAYMAKQMLDYPYEEALDIIKNELNGVDTALLETVDTMFYHGVADVPIKCKNKIGEGEDGVEEVCGYKSAIPFHSIPEYARSIDSTKESLRNRIRYGV